MAIRVSGLHGVNAFYIGLELEDRPDIAQFLAYHEKEQFSAMAWVIDKSFMKLIQNWINENITGNYTSKTPIEHNDGIPVWKFWFQSEEDAVAFKLRWL